MLVYKEQANLGNLPQEEIRQGVKTEACLTAKSKQCKNLPQKEIRIGVKTGACLSAKSKQTTQKTSLSKKLDRESKLELACP